MNDSSTAKTNKVGSGRNITTMNERLYNRGTLMFIEGELSTEMFIIRRGNVRILKQEGDKTVELAILGPGSVLGELSLLDKQPRSATAQVIENVTTSVIDEKLFNHTMDMITGWLANIIKLVVKRLRGTLKKTSDSIVEKSVSGVIRIVLLLEKERCQSDTNEIRIPLIHAKEVISSTIGIGDSETEQVFLHLILKEMVFIRKDDSGKEHLYIINRNIVKLYMHFLRNRQTNKPLLGQDLPDDAIDCIKVILDTGNKVGKTLKPGIIQIGLSQLNIEWQRQGKGKNIDTISLELLVKTKIIFIRRETIKSHYQTHKNDVFIYKKDSLENIVTLHLWLPIFQENIQF